MSEESVQTGNPRLDLRRPDPQDRNAEPNERLIRAVTCLLVERGAELLAESLRPELVTKRAGKSRASYYRTDGFPVGDPNDEARTVVLQKAIERVLTESAESLQQVVGGIAGYIEAGWVSDSPREFMRATAEQNFDEMLQHASAIQMIAGAIAPSSPAVEQILQSYYRSVTSAYAASYNELLQFWGYRPRPPFNAEKLAIVLMALAEGLIVRYFGNGDLDRELYAELLETVGAALIVADGDVADLHLPPEHELPGNVPPPNRGAIIATLTRMFERERSTLPTIEELAHAAGCSTNTIRSQFGGVVGVVRAAWDEWTPEFDEIAERNHQLLKTSDPTTVLYRVALEMATRATEQQPLTRALLMSEIGVDPPSSVTRVEPLAAIFERLLREAADVSGFRPPAVRLEVVGADRFALFARALRSSILSTVVNHPSQPSGTASDHAQWCVDYVWAMMFPPRQPTP